MQNQQFYINKLKYNVRRAKDGFDSDQRSAARDWLYRNVHDYAENVIVCVDCGAMDRPVSMIEGGSTPEYACAICFAERQIQDWEIP